ncbi:ComF family protein [Ideonella sp.]|uniref:ComF family protein n=1 Tax=Ideonella sp. TaxID=1929293 RepID=UPI003BB591D3
MGVDYQFPWDRLITAFKFSGQVELARVLAPLLLPSIQSHLDPDAEPLPALDWICPVPLWHGRLAERGYNQSWELARRLAADLGCPASADLLQRWRATATQSKLDREARLQNMRGAFMVPPHRAGSIAGRHIALVDDVMTTGSTAFEAAQTLLQNGAASVQLWVLARVELPSPA